MADDWDLLGAYALRKDQASFAELAQRHVDLVYNAAKRMLGGPGQEAEDVTQAVFLLLAQKARHIPPRGSLAGWLFRTTRYCCKNVRKSEGRRRRHEREAAMREPAMADGANLTRWHEELGPALDEGLAKLGEKERQAILLRYLENKTAAETGTALDISAEAVEKRLERGLAKLRGFFARRGYAVPAAGVLAVLGAEQARGAPVGLAVKIGSGAGASGAGMAIAKGAATMMMQAKMAAMAGVAAAVLVAASGTGLVITVAHARQSAPANAPANAQGVGDARPMLARWNLLLQGGGAERLKRIGTPVQTASKGYEVYAVGGDPLRTALRDARANGEVLDSPFPRMTWAAIDNIPSWSQPDGSLGYAFMFGYVQPRGQTALLVSSGLQVPGVNVDPRNGVIRLRIPETTHEQGFQVGNSTAAATTRNVTAAFSGDLPVGQAVVFIEDMGAYMGKEIYCASVWEAFVCSDVEFAYIRHAQQSGWIDPGPATMRVDADRAIAWSQKGHAPEVIAAPWEKKLDNGAIVRLVGVGAPLKWPDCWWDAQGKPVADTPTWHQSIERTASDADTLRVVVAVEDPSVAAPTAARGGTTIHYISGDDARTSVSTSSVPAGGRIVIGAGGGPWTDAGAIALGQTVTAHGLAVKLSQIDPALPKNANFPGSAWVRTEAMSDPDIEMRIAAFDKDGKEASEHGGPAIFFGRSSPVSEMLSDTESVELDAADIATCHVQWRRRCWTTFEGFAKGPMEDPSMAAMGPGPAITPNASMVPPAVPIPLPATAPNVSAADASTPGRAVQLFLSAISLHDAKAARNLVVAQTPEEQRLADSTIDALIAADELRAAAEAKFGAPETDAALVQTGFAVHLEPPKEMVWNIEGDHATPLSTRPNVQIAGGPGSMLLRINGQWRIDMSMPKEMTPDKRKQIPAFIDLQNAKAAATRDVIKEIQAGKYKDAYDARDVLRERAQTLQEKMPK